MPVDRAEYWPVRYPGLFVPRLQVPNWARLGIRSVRYPDLPARPCLVRFRPAQGHGQTVFAECAIVNAQPHEFRPAGASANPKRISARSRSPISPASVAFTMARMSSMRVTSFCPGARALHSPDSLHCVGDNRARAWAVTETNGFVCFRDGVQPTLDAAHFQAARHTPR